jgi:hypothetical protein
VLVQLIASVKIFAPKSLGLVLLPLGLPAAITGKTRKEVLGNGVAPSDIARNGLFRNGVAHRQKRAIVTSLAGYANKRRKKYLM